MTSKYKSSATVIPLDEALGKVLAHDITEIRPGQFKGPAFKKGHIITSEDLPHLRRLGKEHIFVLDMSPDEIHEDEAALKLATVMAGPGILFDEQPSEGKVSLRAAHRGLLKVNVSALVELNLVPDMCCASRHNNVLVEAGDIVAAERVIPLVVSKASLETAIGVARDAGGVFSVERLARPRTGLIVTGNEVYHGLIDDKFAPLIRRKLEYYDCWLDATFFAPDDQSEIAQKIHELQKEGMGLILVAGGMSVDPDDVSRLAILEAGATDVVYGTPVLPGAMFLYGRLGDIPVLGLPACVLYYGATVLDLILPRVLAGEAISRRDLAVLSHGGLCLNCESCRYPACPFGKSG